MKMVRNENYSVMTLFCVCNLYRDQVILFWHIIIIIIIIIIIYRFV